MNVDPTHHILSAFAGKIASSCRHRHLVSLFYFFPHSPRLFGFLKNGIRFVSIRSFVFQIVLPTLAKLLGDPQAEVRQAAGESLVGVANLMKPIDLGHHVLTIVLQLAHDDEQVRVCGEVQGLGVYVCM